LYQFAGFAFEEICKEFLVIKNKQHSATFYQLGRYWGNSPFLKKEVEIDIITTGLNESIAYECKFTNESFDQHDLNILIDNTKHLKIHTFGAFSRSGFNDSVKNELNFTYTLADFYNVK
jgi:hypothetical protein